MAYREELAWAAGLFDGEGWITFTANNVRGRGVYFNLGMNQVDRQVLDRFHRAVGGVGKIFGPYPYQTRSGSHARFEYHANGFEKVQAVFAMLYEFLSPVKREQGRSKLTQYLEWRRDFVARKPARDTKSGRILPKEV